MEALCITPEEREKLVLVSSVNYPKFATGVAHEMGTAVDIVRFEQFRDGETSVQYDSNLRGRDVMIIAPFVRDEMSPDEHLVHVAELGEAARAASAKSIRLVAPYLGYLRQDRKDKGRISVGSRVVRNILTSVGYSGVMACDMHSSPIETGYDWPFDKITMYPRIGGALSAALGNEREDVLVISPDAGATKANETLARRLGAPVITMSKLRDENGRVIRQPLLFDVDGRRVVMLDDMIDSGGTLLSAAEQLKDGGAKEIIVAATHAVFTGDVHINLKSDAIDKIYMADTFPMTAHQEALGSKLVVVSAIPLVAQCILAICRDQSIAEVCDNENNR